MQAFMKMGLSEEISTRETLRAPDQENFIIAIKSEVHSLISTTQTLVPISREEADRTNHIRIGTTVKCKQTKKSNEESDKHKAKLAVRGDELAKENAVEHYVSLRNSLHSNKILQTPNEIVGSLPPVDANNRFLCTWRPGHLQTAK